MDHPSHETRRYWIISRIYSGPPSTHLSGSSYWRVPWREKVPSCALVLSQFCGKLDENHVDSPLCSWAYLSLASSTSLVPMAYTEKHYSPVHDLHTYILTSPRNVFGKIKWLIIPASSTYWDLSMWIVTAASDDPTGIRMNGHETKHTKTVVAII